MNSEVLTRKNPTKNAPKNDELASLRQHHFSGQRIIFSLSTSTNSFKRPRPDIWTEFFISCRLMTVDGRFRAVWGGKRLV